MSLLMLQLSLCVLTVIQVTSSQFRSDVTQYQLQRALDRINAASAGKYSYSVGHKDTKDELKNTIM